MTGELDDLDEMEINLEPDRDPAIGARRLRAMKANARKAAKVGSNRGLKIRYQLAAERAWDERKKRDR